MTFDTRRNVASDRTIGAGVRSMTGFGQAEAEVEDVRVVVDVRSVNHRYADVRLRLPSDRQTLERELRARIGSRVRRGRVEITVSVGSAEIGAGPRLDESAVEAVLAAARRLKEVHHVPGEIGLEALLRVPGVLTAASSGVRPATSGSGTDDGASSRLDRAIASCVDAAIDALDADRAREGASLARDLIERAEAMVDRVDRIASRAEELPERLADRLRERLTRLAGEVELDPGRVAQEAAFLADRSDVNEELVRLRSHLEQLRGLVESPDGEPVGKRLDFLVQEILRETNTINSKASDLEISRLAVDLKNEIEKAREQVQNLE